MSPFQVLYGNYPPHILKGSTIPSRLEEVNKLTIVQNELLATLRENLLKSQINQECSTRNLHRTIQTHIRS